jgi:alkyl hydroperoxide reductase subunit F
MGVPTVFLNGERFGQGRMELAEIVGKLDTGAAARTPPSSTPRTRSTCSSSAAARPAPRPPYAARKGIRTGVAAERFGGQVLDTVDIENYISVSKTEGPQFAAALERHVRDYEVDIMNLQRAKALSPPPPGRPDRGRAGGATLRGKTVILSTGARWRNMNVPGEEQYRTKGVTYCPHCDGPLFKGKRVAVIGGGNSASRPPSTWPAWWRM